MSIDEIMTLAQHKDKMVGITYANKNGYICTQHGKLVYVGKTKVIIREPYTNDVNIVRSNIKSVQLV